MQDPAKTGYVAVWFEQPAFVDPLGFVNWTEAVSLTPSTRLRYLYALDDTPAAVACTSLPAMKVKIPPNTGTLDEKELEIEVPYGSDDLFDSFVAGYAVPPTYIVVQEYSYAVGPIDNGDESFDFGRWRLARAILNPDGSIGTIRMLFQSLKSRVNGIPLGIPATPQCAWTLGDKNCGYDLDGNKVLVTVASVDGKTLTLADPGEAAVVVGVTDKRWHRGTFSKDGLVIGIRDFEIGNYTFQLVKEPPPSWAGQSIYIKPGCDKSAGTCNTRFSRLERFGGIGIAIPNYHPILDAPR